MAEVFISYSSHDIEVAKALFKKFEEQGISCWMDKSELKGGADWQENITTGIKSAKVFVLVYSAHAVESRWVLRELTLADDNHLFVIPYNIDGSSIDAKFELILSRLQWINAQPYSGKYNFDELLGVSKTHIYDSISNNRTIKLQECKSKPINKFNKKGLLVIPAAAIALIAIFAAISILKNDRTDELVQNQSITEQKIDVNSLGSPTVSPVGSENANSEADTSVPVSTTVPEESSVQTESEPSKSEFDDRFNALNQESKQESEIEVISEAIPDPGVYTVGDYRISVNSDGSAELLDCDSSEMYITIPEKINGAIITKIGSGGFGDCQNAIEITIPDTVTEIENGAFSGLQSLCTVSLGNGVISIGNGAFRECKLLKKIDLPNSVVTIENSAFANCDNLTEIKLSENLESISNSCFDKCKNLKSIVIPDSVTEIKSFAFRDCTKLESVTFGQKLVKICSSAFEDCSSITELSIPGNVLFIEGYAFSQCISIQSVFIEEGVMDIDGGAFGGCESLSNITLPQSLSRIDTNVFYSVQPSRKLPDSFTAIYKGHSYTKDMLSQLFKDVNG